MSFAICINCGHIKSGPAHKCKKCGFVPSSDEEKAKSIILSLDYELDGEYKGKTKEELEGIAEKIHKGIPYKFKESEVENVINYANSVLSVPPSKLALDFIKWLGLPVAILITVFLILWATK